MSELLKGFCTVLLDNPPRIQAMWDQIAGEDFKEVELTWWCIGEPATNLIHRQHSSQYVIYPKLGKTYMVAARPHYKPDSTLSVIKPSPWAYTVVEVPQAEDKSQYTDLGQVTVIDTPRGLAILVDELREARGQ